MARTAQIVVETIATDHNGSYASVSPTLVREYEPSVATTPRQATRGYFDSGAYLIRAAGAEETWVVVALASNGNTFTVRRDADGEIVRRGRICGIHRPW